MLDSQPTNTTTGRLAGKIAIVTGAGAVGPGWGNGRAIAVRFAQEGATVLAVDLTLQPMDETLALARGAAGEIFPVACDVTDDAAVARLMASCHERFGAIDVLVNNVGGPTSGGPVKLTLDQWNAQLTLNLSTVFITCKHAIPFMEQRGQGAIVNVASTSGIRWTGAAQVGYAAAKAGVIQFGRVVGVEYAKKGIRVNTILPGQLHTPLVDAVLAKDQSGGDIEALLKRRQARIPLPFMGDGRDTANVALFLASDEARFVTATEIIVDGGMSARCD